MPRFQSLFCERFHCSTAEYEERAFRECLYRHARPVAPLIRRVNPEFFLVDFTFIRYLGDAADFREVVADTRAFMRGTWRDEASGEPD